jgi:feruloyl esterase
MAYADSVYAKDASAKADVRLFLLPGMGHCGGGPGPQRVDWLGMLDKWANGGPAPDEALASFTTGTGARKLCAYPKKQVFKGSGDGKSPDQFECR